MAADEQRLIALADAIADGRAVEWDQICGGADDAERSLLGQLRVLAQVADVHRQATSEEPARPLDDSRPPADETAQTGPRVSIGQWGAFELLEQIGAGTFGTVYRAWEPALEREVALKLLDRQPTREVEAGSAVVKEGRLLARVRHPNVITVYGADRHDSRVGIWMEYIRGRTLKELLATQGTFSAHEAALLGISLCHALAAVHHAGLVHRDLKAQNVMREQGGRTLLMDFGAGLDLDPSSNRNAAVVTGTPLYMAPELFDDAPATPLSDLYSLGVLIYHCLTKTYPVSGRTFEDVRAGHESQTCHRLRDVRPGLPSALVQAVDRALSRDPRDRFESAGAMAEALERTFGFGPHMVAPAEARPAEAMKAAEPSAAHRERREADAVARVSQWWLLAPLIVASIAAAFWAFGAVRLRAPADAAPSRISSVAVLPFENLSGPEYGYFSDGVTDLLISSLSKITALRVISRTSTSHYRQAPKLLPEIARELKVEGIIEGSVLRSNDRLRVTAKLILASTDAPLWADSYERNLTDLFPLQAEIARAIARQIRVHVTPQEQQQLAAADTVDPAAQDAYLKGWSRLETLTADGAKDAIAYFEQAVKIAPGYARAYAMLSHAYWFLGSGFNGLSSRDESYTRSRDAALKALELDPLLPRAYCELGQNQFYYEWDWAGAEGSIRRAIALNPSDSDAHQQFGWFQAARGRFEEALAEMKTARELDPISYSRRLPLSAVLYYARRYDESIAEQRAVLTMDPGNAVARFGLARNYSAKGLHADAAREFSNPAAGPEAFRLAELARTYAEAGDRNRASSILDRLTTDVQNGKIALNPDSLGFVYLAMGDRERALALLEEAFAQRSAGLVWLRVDPRFDRLRGDNRFRSLLRRIGLES